MHRLNLKPGINLGGHRLSVNDLAYLDAGLEDLAASLHAILGGPDTPCILSGFQLVDGASTFELLEDAYVSYGGEVYRVPAVPSTPKGGVGAAYKLEILTNVDPDNPVVYASGASFNVHTEKTMRLIHSNTSGANIFLLSNCNAGAWVTHSPTVANFTSSGPGESRELRWRRLGNTLHVYIYLVGQLTASNPVITLPFSMKAAGFNWVHLQALATPTGGTERRLVALGTIQPGESTIFINQADAPTASDNFEVGAFVLAGTFTIELQ